MSHPFFGVSAYPWQRPEAVRFHAVLYRAIMDSARIDMIYKACQEDLPPLTLPAAPDKIWKEVLENLTAYNALQNLCNIVAEQYKANPEMQSAIHGVVEAQMDSARIDMIYKTSQENLPPLTLPASPDKMRKEALENLTAHNALQKLYDIFAEQYKANPEMQSAIHEVVEAQPAVKQYILSDSVIVLDRSMLREQLTLLESEDSPVKVVLVRGEPGSGKSHTRYLFKKMAEDKGAISVYLCEGMVATVDDVVAFLFGMLDASEKIPPHTSTEEAWYLTVCLKLKEIASAKQQPVWIAIDDLGRDPDGKQLLFPEVQKFCDHFALCMTNPAFSRWFRLLLIDYPEGPVPARWKNDFWREVRISSADIQLEHVIEALQAWRATYRFAILDDTLSKLAAGIFAAADGDTPSHRLQRIHDALNETLHALDQAT